jgi:hypothetical protein
MFEKMGKASLPLRVVSPPGFQVNGDLGAVKVRHLHGNQTQAVVQGFIVAGKHQTSVIMGALYHRFKVTEKGIVVKGFGTRVRDRRCDDKIYLISLSKFFLTYTT